MGVDDAAVVGLIGVIVGAVVSLVGTVLVPWWRDTIDRRRQERERVNQERREMLLSAMDALLLMRQSTGTARGDAQARFASHMNRLKVRLTPDEEPVFEVLLVMLALVQDPRHPKVETMVAESMMVLTLWIRGDVRTDAIISEVEARAGINFSEDRRNFTVRRDQSDHR